MALRWLPLALLLPSFTLANDLNNFDFYPKNAQQCLYDAANTANCNGTTVAELNSCQCGNDGDFITNAAKCIGQKDPDDVDDVYTTMNKACGDSGTDMAVNEADFKSAASSGASATATATGTASATGTSYAAKTTSASKTGMYTTTTKGGHTVTVTPTQSADNDDDDGGISTGATIGIAVGAVAIGAIAVAGIVLFIVRRRRRTGEESHPMLPPSSAPLYGPTTFPPTDPSPHLSTYSDTKPAWVHNSAETPQKTWNPVAATGGYPAVPLPQQQQQQPPPVMGGALPQQPGSVFEMEGTTVGTGGGGGNWAIEMPGTIPGQQQQPPQYGGWGR